MGIAFHQSGGVTMVGLCDWTCPVMGGVRSAAMFVVMFAKLVGEGGVSGESGATETFCVEDERALVVAAAGFGGCVGI